MFALAAKKPSSLVYQIFYRLREGAWTLEKEGEVSVLPLAIEGSSFADPLTFSVAALRPGPKKVILQLLTAEGDALDRQEFVTHKLLSGLNLLQAPSFSLTPAALVDLQFTTELLFEVEGSLSTIGFDRVEPMFAPDGPGECAACHNYDDPFKDDLEGVHLASRPFFAWGKSDLVGLTEEQIVLRVLDSLKHTHGVEPMPPADIAPPYSAEQINLVESWLIGGLLLETLVVTDLPVPQVERIELVLYDPSSSLAWPTASLNLQFDDGARVVASATLKGLEFGSNYQADLRVFVSSDRLILARSLAIEVTGGKSSHRLDIKLSLDDLRTTTP
jgi:hypothetical protein